jgi:hypothetical protein
VDARQRAGLAEEVLDDLGHQPLAGLRRLAHQRRASPSRVERVMRRKRSLSTCSTMRPLMTSSVRLQAYISRSIRSSWLAGKKKNSKRCDRRRF